MSQRRRGGTPSNIQALINQNELYAAAVEQAKINLAKQNETRFREVHQSFIHNADVRRNVRRGVEEAKLARNDLIVDRRAKMAALFAQEREEWNRQLQEKGYAISQD